MRQFIQSDSRFEFGLLKL